MCLCMGTKCWVARGRPPAGCSKACQGTVDGDAPPVRTGSETSQSSPVMQMRKPLCLLRRALQQGRPRRHARCVVFPPTPNISTNRGLRRLPLQVGPLFWPVSSCLLSTVACSVFLPIHGPARPGCLEDQNAWAGVEVLTNNRPLYPYIRLDRIVNPWGYGSFPIALRLDENSVIEFVVRGVSSEDSDSGDVITTVAGRIVGRYWYNTAYEDAQRRRF